MNHPMTVTLLTDFGTQDAYVGVMKGVIAQINPKIQVIDVTHAIPPQDIAAARFNLMTAYPHFPQGTVHVAVVDPGVGTTRRAIAIQLGSSGYVVAPDNGLASGVISQVMSEKIRAIELDNSDYWYTPTPSRTFHGRDIFSPVGAHLASGVSIQQLGSPISVESLVHLSLPSAQPLENGFSGVIQYIDVFGNLVTTIPGETVKSKQWSAQFKSIRIQSSETYGINTNPGERTAIIGSHGWVEIAVNGGHAAHVLNAAVGENIAIRWE